MLYRIKAKLVLNFWGYKFQVVAKDDDIYFTHNEFLKEMNTFMTGYVCTSTSSAPIPCADGEYNVDPVASSCTVCDAGSYCPTTSAMPFPCETGNK